MKILLHCHCPFLLAHGGAQIQIEQTKQALENIGVDVEYLRWFDSSQTGDILHFFGRLEDNLLNLAHSKRMKVVMAELMTEQGSRSPARLRMQKLFISSCRRVFGQRATSVFNWNSYKTADAFVALTSHEAWLFEYLFGAAREKIHVVPNGVEEVFLNSAPATRGKWLVCTATIHPRKRVLELAEAAVLARTPLWIVGKPYSDSDAYAQKFIRLAATHPEFVRFEGPVQDRQKMAFIYREARGFVLLSAMESLSLSALEAAACGCPQLLGDLPWARTVFKDTVRYCPVTPDASATATALRKFYDDAPGLKPPEKPMSWDEVAGELKSVYERLLSPPRTSR